MICTDGFNKSTRKKVTCHNCNFFSCENCTQTYLLGSTQDPHCMSCHVPWDTDFMFESFTRKFVKDDYKAHRENVLFEREKSMLVATMPLVENEKQRRIFRNELDQLKNDLKTYKTLVKETEMAIYRKMDEIRGIGIDRDQQKSTVTREFIRACPADGCKGFLHTDWKCAVCSVSVCKKCHEVKNEEEHTCDPQNVETANAIMKETRPCPKCAARIFKIDGCDQMWCTQCQTAFSWRTGLIETKIIHNPHYYEYMRRTGGNMPRENGDIVCGGYPTPNQFVRFLRTYFNNSTITDPYIHMLRELIHIHQVVMPSFRVNNERDANADVRVKYILGELQDVELKRLVQMREKHRVKSRDMYMILDTLTTVCVDIFQRIMNIPDLDELQRIRVEIQAICDHVNECFKRHSKKYNSVLYQINKDTCSLASASSKKPTDN